MNHPHVSLPASAVEIKAVLEELRELANQASSTVEEFAPKANTQGLSFLLGLLDSFQGRAPHFTDPDRRLAHRVGQSLQRGGTPWL